MWGLPGGIKCHLMPSFSSVAANSILFLMAATNSLFNTLEAPKFVPISEYMFLLLPRLAKNRRRASRNLFEKGR